MSPPPTSDGALFLSYARDDAATARRIAEALRASGLEVWFDESELRGGDTWDTKIRRQIKDCALFLPIVSAHTQARGEGYFRLEWKLAVERTHLMAEGMPFLAPIVIDDTKESVAVVPAEFMRVQWTRLPGALPTPEFVGQVKRLLGGKGPAAATVGASLDDDRGRRQVAPRQKKSLPAWVWIGLPFAAVAIGAIFTQHKSGPPVAPAQPVAAVAPVAPVAADKSIAVLPFTNMSEDKDSGYFADGVHEDILTNLSNVRELRVVSRTSVLQYRTTTKTIPQIAQELGVAYVLEGSVRRAGNQVRVTGQLIKAGTEGHVWAKAYDRDLTDIFAIQAELAQSIATALQAALSPQEKARLARAPTSNTAAYDLYLKALAEGDNFDRARPLLESAVQLDPQFAQAWGQLGRSLLEINKRRPDPTGALPEKAQRATDTMERLAPDEPDTLLRLVSFYSRANDFVRAETYLGRAAQALPGNGEVVLLLGDVEKRHHRFPEALAHYRKAYELDRQSPAIQQTLGYWLIALRRYAEAESISHQVSDENAALIALAAHGSTREIETFLAAHPDDLSYARSNLAFFAGLDAEYIRLEEKRQRRDGADALSNNEETQVTLARLALGDTVRAKADAVRYLASHEGSSGRLRALNLALSGEKQAALECMESYLAETRTRGVDLDLSYFPAGGASVLAWAGEKEKAVAELARLFKLPAAGVNVHVLRRCPLWRPLQGYPPFEALLNDPKNNQPLF